ncbi:tumor protein D53 isoform X4 [Pleuronectes platessa]|uniref:tumor protein D53 isoform X4 n=1 Tax=Pleuronectes platessa TaxID=8262 RepID=UPI00232A27DD|nr:tumor protein D53 isoform X4 [Pleuronectes platessa]
MIFWEMGEQGVNEVGKKVPDPIPHPDQHQHLIELYSSVLSEEAVVDWGSVGPGEEWVNSATQEGEQGFLDSEPLKEADEDLVSEVNLNNSIMTEEEREEAQQELAKLEEEISTLRQVLASKEKQHAELKQKLGISPLSELRTNFTRGWHDMQCSSAYRKTSETFSTAGQKTSAAFSTFGTTITKKFGDMRNSPSFKSFEEKVENTVSTIKTKVGGTGAGGSFEEVLSSAANASSQDTPTNNLTDSSERQC